MFIQFSLVKPFFVGVRWHCTRPTTPDHRGGGVRKELAVAACAAAVDRGGGESWEMVVS